MTKSPDLTADRIQLLTHLHRPYDAYLPEHYRCSVEGHDVFDASDGNWCCVTCTVADGGPTKVCHECRDDAGDPAPWPTITDELVSSMQRDDESAGDDQILFKSLELKDGKIELSAETTGELDAGLGVLLDHMGDMLDVRDATNYIEFELIRRHKRPINVCVRWLHHPTPHELRRRAEADRDALAAELDRWKNSTAAAAVARVQALADRLRGALNQLNGEPDIVAAAFAAEIDRALADPTPEQDSAHE